MVSCLVFALSVSATQQIKIEIVSLVWNVRVAHKASFRAHAILPDGTHLLLACRSEENLCDFSGNLRDASGCDREHMPVTCTATRLGLLSGATAGRVHVDFELTGKEQIPNSWRTVTLRSGGSVSVIAL
jgi:hypothetical protein